MLRKGQREVEWKKKNKKQDIREKGDEILLLFIAFNLPFDDITDVHHCQEEKTNVSVITESNKY